jgi:hypothetical protein
MTENLYFEQFEPIMSLNEPILENLAFWGKVGRGQFLPLIVP